MLPHIPPNLFPGVSFAAALYLEARASAPARSAASCSSTPTRTPARWSAPAMELVRLAIPRRVYSHTQLDPRGRRLRAGPTSASGCRPGDRLAAAGAAALPVPPAAHGRRRAHQPERPTLTRARLRGRTARLAPGGPARESVAEAAISRLELAGGCRPATWCPMPWWPTTVPGCAWKADARWRLTIWFHPDQVLRDRPDRGRPQPERSGLATGPGARAPRRLSAEDFSACPTPSASSTSNCCSWTTSSPVAWTRRPCPPRSSRRSRRPG